MKKNTVCFEQLKTLERSLKRIPSDSNEWVKTWIDHIEGFNVKHNNLGTCNICDTEKVQLIALECECKKAGMCLECILKTWYSSTEGLMKSSMCCPFCKHELVFNKILDAVDKIYGIYKD
jgi:hypothetical protein